MKIGPLDKNSAIAQGIGERAGTTPGKAATAQAEASVQVELSQAASAIASGDDSFDAEKVQRIAAAIRDGQYKVDAEAIADKLIANAQELLGKTPQ